MQIPKNVVQTGQVDACHKIYIEDYVHTFLKQYQKKESDFCLYGTCETEGDVSYYFLYGAVREEPGWEMMENRYFSGCQRIGEAAFDEKEAWFFFEDGYSASMDGYFIFYEQNEDMQSYLIAMHQNQPGEKPAEARSRTSHPGDAGADHSDDTRTEQSGAARADHHGDARAALHQAGHVPRRIHRTPRVYDLPSASCADRSMRDKLLHAAQAGERQRRIAHAGERRGNQRAVPDGRENMPSVFPAGRGAAAALLMILCAVAVVSLNHPEEMREAGNFFAEAARELDEGDGDGASGETGTAGNGSDQGEDSLNTAFLVEERQLSDNDLPSDTGMSAEMTTQIETETLFPIFTADLGLAESLPAETADAPIPVGETETAAFTSSADQAERQEDVSAQAEGPAAEETTAPKAEEASAQPASSYVIQNGDNLAAICRRRYGSTDRMEEIVSLNGLSDPNHLIPGQEIMLPQ